MAENAEFQQLAEKAFMTAMQEIKDITKWTRIPSAEKLFCYNKPAEYNTVDQLKCEMYIDQPPRVLNEYFHEHLKDLTKEHIKACDVSEIFHTFSPQA